MDTAPLVVPCTGGHRLPMSMRSAGLEQALVDAESWRSQAELMCADSQLAYDAARQTLLASQQALAAAGRTTETLRALISADLLEG